MSIFIQTAYAADAAAGQPSMLTQLAMPLIFVAVFYFFIIRPQSKRNKEHQALINALSTDDEVVFAGGLMGTVKKIDGDYAVIELGKNNEIKVQRATVISILPKGTIENLDSDYKK